MSACQSAVHSQSPGDSYKCLDVGLTPPPGTLPDHAHLDFPGDSYNNCLDVVGLTPPPGTLLDHDSFNITVQFSAPTDFERFAFEGTRAFLTTSYIDYSPRLIPQNFFYAESSKQFVTLAFSASSEKRQLMKSVNCIIRILYYIIL